MSRLIRAHGFLPGCAAFLDKGDGEYWLFWSPRSNGSRLPYIYWERRTVASCPRGKKRCRLRPHFPERRGYLTFATNAAAWRAWKRLPETPESFIMRIVLR